VIKKDKNTEVRRQDSPIILGGLIVLLILLTYLTNGIYKQLISAPEWAKLQPNMQLRANSIAAEVNTFIDKRLKQQINLIDTIQHQQLTALNVDELQNIAERLNSGIDDSEHSYIITQAHPEPLASNNFVAMVMSRQLLSGEKAQPQATKHDDEWRILIASSFKTQLGQPPEGAIISSLAISALKENLQTSTGKVVLSQNIPGNRSTAILTIPHSNTMSNSVSAGTANPFWKITFTPSSSFIEQYQPSQNEYLLFYVCLSAASVILAWLIFRLFLKWYTLNQIRTQKQIKEKATEQAILDSATSFLSAMPETEENASKDNTEVFELIDQVDENPRKDVPANIFRSYDIRGIYNKDINEEFAYELGMAFGSLAQRKLQQWVAVARDGRISSPSLYLEVLKGIEASGCNTVEIGQVPTPLLNFALKQFDLTLTGISITASHNPAEYTGFKMVLNGNPLTAEQIQDLRQCMLKQDYLTGQGKRAHQDVVPHYIQQIKNDIEPIKNLSVVIDASNGVTGPIAPELFSELGCKVSSLYCDVDGTFPYHEPDTSVAANLEDLIQIVKVQKADLGIALDGDGDRVVAITATGKIVWPDELMMIFAKDILSNHPAANIVFDIKCTSRLAKVIRSYGGKPTIWKTGHSNMRSKIQELDAPLGGEYSGHIFFCDRWDGFDDGMYAAARLMEILSKREQSLDEILATLPQGIISGEYKVDISDEQKFEVIAQLIENADFKDGKLTTLDGLRVDFDYGWGLARASNTTPALTLRFEGDTHQDLKNIATLFKQQLRSIDPTLTLNF